MKRIITVILTIALAAAFMPGVSSGQAKITTKKVKLSDFTTKTTRVVLAGSEIFSNTLKEEISRRWMISPYEFCSLEEYEATKNSTNYYFLIPVSSRFKKEAEPGIIVLSLVKGGESEASSADKEGFEVMSIPCAATDSQSGREFVFLPALIDIIQRYMSEAMISDRVSYGGLAGLTAGKMLKERDKKIVFSADDLASTAAAGDDWEARNMTLMDEDDADELFTAGTANTLVSFTVSPIEPQKGSVCYKMIISADTHELCYFDKHQIKGNGAGFQPLDLKAIALPRKK